ncbi:SRPBCC family protein [Roseovarius autotrophicus]|uniref:SRPBCC family protein n=1 Tax=Roseovarius autotrophicus TaxID=2824121 RepID=UPI0019DDD4C6|nr:SRPBCC family protein [Roseovarius autotrophicus]MBE0452889.1 SRPBCC family protein [Roseovarius sp.]
MQFTSKEDIEAPIERVFADIIDVQRFERAALRRGADVQRIDSLNAPGVGMSWRAKFRLRGRMRNLSLRLADYDPPNGIAIEAEAATLEGRMTVDLIALSRARTRLTVDLALEPRTLAGRLIVQSLKLARGNVSKRFRLRLAEFARDLEDRYKRAS